ncbi:MAG: VacJ family lipoprotein [Gammaproteobacteria bacterium]|nr:VacJ family lipoprotein [Gammaproteobacteria bacterium]
MIKATPKRICWQLLIILGGLTLCACAWAGDPDDPWEGMNRKVYSFNDAVDRIVLTPVTRAYQAVVPDAVETGVDNFFSNLGDVGVALNNLLQLKPGEAGSDTGRVLVNTTLGFFGWMDVASQLGMTKHNEDFGQTLGYWGIGTGPYLVLPFLGPSNLRDGPGMLADITLWTNSFPDLNASEESALISLNVVSERGQYLALEERTEELGRDQYVFIRDAYLDNREFLVRDGEFSLDDELYEGLDDE